MALSTACGAGPGISPGRAPLATPAAASASSIPTTSPIRSAQSEFLPPIESGNRIGTSDVDVPPSAPAESPTPSPPLVEAAGERIDVAAVGSAVSATPPAVVPGLATRLAAATGGVPPNPTAETVGATIPAPRLTPTATPRPAQLSVVSASPLPRPSATPVPVPALPSVSVAIVEPAGQPPTSWQFQPLALTVKLGTTVRWVNTGTVPHNVTADDGRFTSGLLDAKATFSFTPSAAGSLSYSCTFHPWMKGTLTVTP